MPALGFFRDKRRGLEYDADGEQVVNIFERNPLSLHFRPDGEYAFDAPGYGEVDVAVDEPLPDWGDEPVDEFGTVRFRFIQLADDVEVLLRIAVAEAQVFQFRLDGIQAEPVRERGEQIERLARYLDLLVARHGGHRPHVVKPVRYLDEDYPYIVRQGEQHLAEIGGLFRRVGIDHTGHFGQTVHHIGYLFPEDGFDFFDRIVRILHHVVQQGCGHGLNAQSYFFHDDFGHGQGMENVGLPAAPQHSLVSFPGEEERLAYQLPVLFLLNYLRT